MDLENGELIPNRIFVGGLPLAAKDAELEGFFSKISGCVKEVKIIMDGKGTSKGFGFVTFETEAEATKLLNTKKDSLLFKDAKLNLATAYRRKTYYNNNNNTYNYNHKSGNSHYKQSHMTNLQIDNHTNNPERYLISPTSGKAINAMTPTPPPIEKPTETEAFNDAEPTKINNDNNVDSVGSVRDITNSPKDEQLEEKEFDSENICEIQREDKNNNIITKLTKMPENDIIKTGREEDEEISNNPVSPSLVDRKNKQANNYHNHSNQRNYHGNYRGNSNNNFQSQHNNNRFQNFQAHSPNNNHSKFNNQMQKAAMQSQHQPFHYYYAMAAAIASGNIHSPGYQGHNSKVNFTQKNKQHGDSFQQGGKKSSHNYVGSVMNSNPNLVNHTPHLIEPNSQPNFQNGLKNNNYQLQQSHDAVPVNTNQYAYNYQNQQHSNSSGNASNHVQSTPSYSSSSSSSVSSSTPNHQPAGAQVQPQYVQNPNNPAVSYVNYNVPVNTSAPGLVINHAGYPEQYAQDTAMMSPYAIPVNQQYTVYPNYYYNNSVNQSKPQQSMNTSPNSQAASTDYNNTISSATPSSLTPQSQYNSNQSQSIYYSSSSSSGAPLVQHSVKTPTEVNNNYAQQSSTITNAFETATKSTNDQMSLEDSFKKNLTLQTDNNLYPQQPQFYYLAQPGYPGTTLTNNGPVNPAVPVNTSPQYFYYYAPASGTPINPNYQMTPTLGQPLPFNNQGILINQQSIEPQNNPNFTPNPPTSYPIQINTVQPNQMPPNQGPLSGPHPHQMPQVYSGQKQPQQPYNLPQQVLHPPPQMQASGGAPLLQLPNVNYQTQQIPVPQNNTLVHSPQNQNHQLYKQNIQSPGKQTVQNKGQHYQQNPMYQIEGPLDNNFSPSYQKNTHSNKYDQNYRQNSSTGQYRGQNKGNYNGKYNNINNKPHYKSNQYHTNYNSCSTDIITKSNNNGFNSRVQNPQVNVANFSKNEQQTATETTV